MFMKPYQFFREQFGGVTTDWIVLTAGLILMTFIVMNAITGGTTNVTDHLDTTFTSLEPAG